MTDGMERIGDSAEELAEMIQRSAQRIEEESSTCDGCGGKFPSVLVRGDESLCRGCYEAAGARERVEEQAAAIEPVLDQVVDNWLLAAGLAAREVTARIDYAGAAPIFRSIEAVPKALACAAALARGEVPTYGFGLSGGAGIGKTFALAAIFRRAVDRWLRSAIRSEGRAAIERSPFLTWLPWPQVVGNMRAASVRDGGFDAVARRVDDWKGAKALVIDDLGAERMKGSYVEDWTFEALDAVVDERLRAMRPTWYTTNVDERALVERYGARFVSRLCRENPLVVLDRARDQRGEGGKR